ncbi:MAG TPA: DUF4133 domain-containing protein [Mucilaginibacter sp.]|nr:DUF4133 domain-containing protein [Mucilaginibacter sp.]
MSTVYQINKGINKPIVFKGLQGQYIGWLAAGLVVLLIAFALLYVAGLTVYLLLPLILGLGTGLFWSVGRLSKRFGVHGMEKYFAKRGLPRYVAFRSRRVFTGLKKQTADARPVRRAHDQY